MISEMSTEGLEIISQWSRQLWGWPGSSQNLEKNPVLPCLFYMSLAHSLSWLKVCMDIWSKVSQFWGLNLREENQCLPGSRVVNIGKRLSKPQWLSVLHIWRKKVMGEGSLYQRGKDRIAEGSDRWMQAAIKFLMPVVPKAQWPCSSYSLVRYYSMPSMNSFSKACWMWISVPFNPKHANSHKQVKGGSIFQIEKTYMPRLKAGKWLTHRKQSPSRWK